MASKAETVRASTNRWPSARATSYDCVTAATGHRGYIIVYRRNIFSAVLATWIGSLSAWAVDFAVTLSRSDSADGAFELALIGLGLHTCVGLALGILIGLVFGAVTASFGEHPLTRAISRLYRDDDTDAWIASIVLTALVTGGVYVGFVAQVAIRLVGQVERYQVGAWLLGCVVVMTLPAFVALGLPIQRVMRRLARFLPNIPIIPRSFLAVAIGILFGASCCAFVILTRLDWRALNPADIVGALVFLIAATGSGLFLRKILFVGAVRRLSTAVVTVTFTMITGILGGCLWAARTPPVATMSAISDHSLSTRWLVSCAQAASDFDKDGYSALLGGSDCNDDDPAVHPDAKEIPGNGIDDNCQGGDRPLPATPAGTAKPADTAKQDPDTLQASPASKQRLVDNVLILTIDTVRADRLGITGYQRDGKSLTPSLDAFATQATHFRMAYAQAPNTPRSFPSLFTSRFPSQVHVKKQFANYAKLLDKNITVFEQLQTHNIRTIGFSSHFYFKAERGIRQGFDEYDNEGAKSIADSNKDIASPRTVPKVIARLETLAATKQRFAMFVHLFEPHSTYVKHPEYPITLRKIPGLIQKYDYEISYVDKWIAVLFKALDTTTLSANTLVVVLSDHGEAFGTHRRYGKKMFFHGQTLYDELLRVPLLFRLPGSPATTKSRTVDSPVMLIDVAPTILEALGVPAPRSFVGRSLLPGIVGSSLPPQAAYGELLPAPSWNHAAKMLVTPDGKYKLLYRMSDRRFELYDLTKDPQEQQNLAATNPSKNKQLQNQLLHWIEVELPSR